MSDADKIRRLTDLFRKLGAPEPEGWARSEVDEGIPQLARFLFLRQAWRSVVSDENPTWIDALIKAAERDPAAPYAGAGHALKSLRAKGATDEELVDLVRGVQAESLFSFCYLLGDPGDVEEEVAHIAWGLFQIDENGSPIEAIPALHESVLETDPTSREMRPKRDG